MQVIAQRAVHTKLDILSKMIENVENQKQQSDVKKRAKSFPKLMS